MPTIFARPLRLMGRKQCHVVSRGANNWRRLPMQVVAVEFVYSLNMRKLFESRKMYRSSFTEFQFILAQLWVCLWSSLYPKTTTIVITRILPLPSLTWQVLHVLFLRINKRGRDCLYWQLLWVVCLLRGRVALCLSHHALRVCRDGRYRE